jgi:hypothetical protein
MFGVFSELTFFGKLTFWSVDFLEVDHFSQCHFEPVDIVSDNNIQNKYLQKHHRT